MNANLFVEYLPWLRSPRYYYALKEIQEGWTKDDVEDALQYAVERTSPIERGNSSFSEDIPSELRDLYGGRSLEKISLIGGISFWSEPKKLNQGWGFADMSEVNFVVAPAGRIEAFAANPIRGMPGATDCLGVLAKDLGSCLEALLYAQLNRSHFLRGFPDENPILFERTVLVAKHCALIAGGYEYYDFWAGIMGLPPEKAEPQP
ncbi:hypothetical protein MASR2M32_01850 [Sphaerotilus sulfidivorans]